MISRRAVMKSTAAGAGMLVAGRWARAAVDLPRIGEDGSVAPGSCYLDDPAMPSSLGAGPNLYLCWNAIPANGDSVDIVLHLHGWSDSGPKMQLSEKVKMSGLNLDGRARPTIGIIPRGQCAGDNRYHFPALHGGGAARLVRRAQDLFFESASRAGYRSARAEQGRFILTVHSGGGAELGEMTAQLPYMNEIHVFDALYSDPVKLIRWAENRLLDDAGAQARADAQPGEGGHAVRVIDLSTPNSRKLAVEIERRLAALPSGLQDRLRQRYRVEKVKVADLRDRGYAEPLHPKVPVIFGPALLSDVARSFAALSLEKA